MIKKEQKKYKNYKKNIMTYKIKSRIQTTNSNKRFNKQRVKEFPFKIDKIY